MRLPHSCSFCAEVQATELHGDTFQNHSSIDLPAQCKSMQADLWLTAILSTAFKAVCIGSLIRSRDAHHIVGGI